MGWKVTWERAVLYFLLIEAGKSKDRVQRKALIEHHMQAIVYVVGSVGPTPDQTLSATLQSMRDAGIIRFEKDRPGVYTVLVSPAEVMAEVEAMKGGRIIGLILTSVGITYKREVLFSKGYLRYDVRFDLLQVPFALEYQGVQHYLAI